MADDPIPPVALGDAVENAQAAIRLLKQQKPATEAGEREKSVQLMKLEQTLLDASRRALSDAVAAKHAAPPSNGKAASGETALTTEDFPALAEAIVPFVREVVTEAMTPLLARIDALEQRPQLSYEGVWSETKAYNAGSFCTHAGSLWFAADSSLNVRPGGGSSAWKLAVKRGKADDDGRQCDRLPPRAAGLAVGRA